MHDGRTPYSHRLEALIRWIEEPNREACELLIREHAERFAASPGSLHNHQAWPGGYVDHICEVMNIALELHKTLDALRPLPFKLSDAMLVLFLHDLEKPWRFETAMDGTISEVDHIHGRDEKRVFRESFIVQYGIVLTPEQENALTYVEGEIDHYSATERIMNPLAAFCHLCDVTSARIWFDHPRPFSDAWYGSRRTIR